MSTILVTGANRGLGLEFVRQLKAKGHRVIGTARRPSEAPELGKLADKVIGLDVTDLASIEALAGPIGGEGVDWLINNAGISSQTKSVATMDAADLRKVLEVNAVGPIMVTKALLALLRKGTGKKIVNISSQLGSIANNTGGSSYAYRASKTGLNQLTVSLANELRPMGIACVMAHPGWVQTDMGGKEATLTPEVSVRGLVSIVDQAELSMSGRFLNYDGNPLPW
jgi:NAD(P)-dependent dehydrogenase (short-subunit alcohol dehydrogenase family)